MEICNVILRFAVARKMKIDSLIDLIIKGVTLPAITWRKCLVKTKSATVKTNLSVAIGATESRIYGEFLYASAKALTHNLAILQKWYFETHL